MINKIIELSNQYEKEVIKLRRSIHEEPELSFQEVKTVKKIEEVLRNYGIEVSKYIAGTGMTALIHGNEPGPVLLLRADMDALPIEEKTRLSFSSKNSGVMHACGHDVHSAALVGTGIILKQLAKEWKGTVKLVFQPAEESGGGGREMVKEGVLTNPKVDACIALHTCPSITPGVIAIGDNEITACSDSFTITIKGKNAHSSAPQEGVDAVNIAAHIIVALNSILSKMISPLDSSTFNIGQIYGGRVPNILADEVVLKGMMRNIKDDCREIIIKKIRDIADGTANMLGGEAVVEIKEGYPQVRNNVKLSESIRKVFKEKCNTLLDGIESHQDYDEKIKSFVQLPQKELGAEDFGFYTKDVPSCFYWVGTGNYAPAHTSCFQIDEKYIKLCIRSMSLAAIHYLKYKGEIRDEKNN